LFYLASATSRSECGSGARFANAPAIHEENKMTKFLKGFGFCLALAMSGVTLSGCAALKEAAAKQQRLDEKTRAYVHQKPLAEVWPEARKLLFEAGFEVKDQERSDYLAMETLPKLTGEGSEKYLVQGIKVDEGSKCRVEFTKLSNWHKQTSSDRDFDMEYELIKRLDPSAAAKIKSEADTLGTKVSSK
jgi:hypothetical protein